MLKKAICVAVAALLMPVLAFGQALSTAPFNNANSIPGLYNWTPSNFVVGRKVLGSARAGTARSAMICIGDSLFQGIGAGTGSAPVGTVSGDARRGAICAYVAQTLAANGYNVTYDSTWGDGEQGLSGLVTYDPKLTFGAGWSVPGGATFKSVGGQVLQVVNSTAARTFVPDGQTDSCDWYYVSGNGAFTLNIDGGTNISVAAGGGSSLQVVKVGAAASQTVSVGTHTLNIQGAASGTSYHLGGVCYNSLKPQMDIFNMGVQGWKSSDWDDASTVSTPLNALLGVAFVYSNNGQAYTTTARAGTICLIELGANDANGDITGVAIPAFITHLASIVAACQITGDVVLVSQAWQADASLSPIVTAPTTVQAAYKAAELAYANANNLRLVDLAAYMPPYAAANTQGMFWGDHVHLRRELYAEFGVRIAEALMTR